MPRTRVADGGKKVEGQYFKSQHIRAWAVWLTIGEADWSCAPLRASSGSWHAGALHYH